MTIPSSHFWATLSPSALMSPEGSVGIIMNKPGRIEEDREDRRLGVHVEERRRGEDHVSSLIFERITREDKGNYTCLATINGDNVKRSFKLIVIKPISFYGTPPEQNATEHQNVLVKCEVTGDPSPVVVWQFKGKTLQAVQFVDKKRCRMSWLSGERKGGSAVNRENGERYKVMPRGLYISNITHEDMGVYQCRAFQTTSQTSKILVKSINLNVLHKPRWRGVGRQQKNKTGNLAKELAYGYLSGMVNLSCEAEGRPAPTFVWRRNNTVLVTGAMHYPYADNNITIINEPHRTVLQFLVTGPGVLGDYECSATNSLGKIKKTIELELGVKPKRPTLIAVEQVGVHSAQFNIEHNHRLYHHPYDDVSAIVGYRIQFTSSKTNNGSFDWTSPDYQDVYTNDGSGGSPYTIVDLKERTDYAGRAAARNLAGLSDFTEEVTFRTRDPTISIGSLKGAHPLLCVILLCLVSLH
ncbi:hypothetical protein AAG570_006364 [Ranatra chinensis]|uniref:Uncharacterized protein n=1 Tax=Ranatra chinensis TaxID=642074 RepID=A0ABD0YTS5_9HEMI